MALIYRILIFLILLLPVTLISAQNNKYSRQFHIITENDCYTSLSNDGYYTNGLILSYQWRPKMTDSLTKTKINNIELGQYIYNAEDGHYDIDKIDRPITGYLYGSYLQKRFNEKQDLLKWGLSLGVIGKPAMGEQVQIIIHDMWHLYETPQWKYQLQTAWGITGSVAWSPQLIDRSRTKKIDFKPIFGASLGNMFTNVMAGSALLLGRFNNNSSTAFWGNHTGRTKKDHEFFFYIYPAVYLQAYNATVQGNMFKHDTTLVPGKLNPFFFQGKLGVVYSLNNFSLGYNAVYENKQSLTQRAGQYYGSIQICFMW